MDPDQNAAAHLFKALITIITMIKNSPGLRLQCSKMLILGLDCKCNDKN